MDFFLSRYRNITVLLIVIVAQLLLIAYQVKGNRDVPLIRVWAVTAVTPAETALEVVRHYTWGFVEDYFVLLGVKSENDRLKRENGDLKLQNHYLKSELSTADRARALSVFQAHSQSKTVAARVIGNGTGANSKVVFVDRGSTSGVESGMAVVTPDGIVGKVVDAYPTASLVMLITDPTFAAGVVSQKNHVHGTLKGQGHSECLVDYVQNEEPVDAGEWFFTSGDDRIFPKGFPVGQVSAARNGKTFKEIYLVPSGMQGGVEEVLVVLEGVHQQIPDGEVAAPGYKILALPPNEAAESSAPQTTGPPAVLVTDADRLREQYRQAGQAQNHVFGVGLPGSKPPDFTKIPGVRAAAPAPNSAPGAAGTPATPAGPPGPNPATASGSAGKNPPAAKPQPAAAPADAATVPKPKPRPAPPVPVADPNEAGPDAVAPAAAVSEKPANLAKPAAPAAAPGAPTRPPAPAPPNTTNQ
ncbi:MAG TPA: rod shape-determining protein MreC [Bryobacteraceae bacterium]|nr:rod shape-determining protein MreC [Bryobacteraceae bacterium]